MMRKAGSLHNPGRFIIIALGAMILAMAFCNRLYAEGRIPVCVSIMPQQYFVQQIGKDLVDVQVMVPPGASPETYEPKPAQMTALAKTRFYFSLGVPFETVWLKKIAAINPGINIIHTDNGIQKEYLGTDSGSASVNNQEAARQNPSMSPSEEGTDPHIWLSPPLVMMQARMILIALQQADPARWDVYEQNYRNFILHLTELDGRLRKLFADIRTRDFMVLHPAWGYFARAYGLTQVPIEEEGKSPRPAQLKEMIDYARQHKLSVILAQPESSTKWAEQVANAINGRIVLADPLSPDWDQNLLKVAETIKASLR